MERDDIRRNRDNWNAEAAAYQRAHGDQLAQGMVWGVWAIPEGDLNALGDVGGKDVLELGCGAAAWGLALARAGARVTGIDLSAEQLRFARASAEEQGVTLELVCCNAEATPFEDASFDIVFCDHGAMTFADPFRTVPEVARLLRPGGLLAFNIASPLHELCWDPQADEVSTQLHGSLFGMHRVDEGSTVSFVLPHGEWIRLFARHGLQVVDLLELQPPEGARTTYPGFVPLAWARRWPAENLWRAVKA